MLDKEDYQPENKKTKDNHKIKTKIESENVKIIKEDDEEKEDPIV